MEIKIRPAKAGSPYRAEATWYDYKMASVATLTDYGLYLRMKGDKRDVITVYRSGVSFRHPEAVVYESRKYLGWKAFYEDVLPKIIEEHGVADGAE